MRVTSVVSFHREDFEVEQNSRVAMARPDEPLARAVDKVLVRIIRRVDVARHAGRYVAKTTCRIVPKRACGDGR